MDINVNGYKVHLNEKLGDGGDVYKATAPDGKPCAVKHLRQTGRTAGSVIREVANELVLMRLDHPNIVKLYDFYSDDRGNFLFLELCDSDLVGYLSKNDVSEDERLDIIRQFLASIEELHKKKVVHRDIKPGNILLKDGVVKITDFGLSKNYDDSSTMHTGVGTRAFSAPELLDQDGFVVERGDYKKSIDIYSAGLVIAYICLADKDCFEPCE